MITAWVAVEYKDVQGLYPVGSKVSFPDDREVDVKHLIQYGILTDRQSEPEPYEVIEDKILPDTPDQPSEGVKTTPRTRAPRKKA